MSEANFELTPDRLELLTDGVFAIVMTLLVLEIHLPTLAHEAVASQLIPALQALVPKFTAYVISFILLGIYWIGHHNLFHFIKRVDRVFLWMNTVFLMLVALIPFTAGLLGEYGDQQIAIILYGLHLIVMGILLSAGWEYATRHHHLVDPRLKPEFIQVVRKVILFGPACYIVAILASFFHSNVSMLIYAFVPLYYILPNHVDRHLPRRQEHKHDEKDAHR